MPICKRQRKTTVKSKSRSLKIIVYDIYLSQYSKRRRSRGKCSPVVEEYARHIELAPKVNQLIKRRQPVVLREETKTQTEIVFSKSSMVATQLSHQQEEEEEDADHTLPATGLAPGLHVFRSA